ASTDTGGSGLKGYNVYVWKTSTWTFVRQVLAPATSASNTGLSALTAYYYSVAAVDNAGNASALSNWISVSTPSCTTATTTTITITTTSSTTTTIASILPTIPTAVTSSAASCSQINLFWGASTDAGGPGLQGYNVYVWQNSTWVFFKLVLAPATSTSNTGLSALTSYYFALRAVDKLGKMSALST